MRRRFGLARLPVPAVAAITLTVDSDSDSSSNNSTEAHHSVILGHRRRLWVRSFRRRRRRHYQLHQ